MSDITRKCIFVLHLFKDLKNNIARCVAVSEFILPHPALSFNIIDSYKVKASIYNQFNNVNNTKALEDSHLQDSLTGEQQQQLPHQLMSLSSYASSLDQSITINPAIDSDTDLVTIIRLYCIQTKQLQEMQIFLTGKESIDAYSNLSNSPPHPIACGASPVRFNSVSLTGSSTASSNAQLINSLTNFQAKLNLTGNESTSSQNLLKTSNSFNSSDLKDMQSMQASSEVNASDNKNDESFACPTEPQLTDDVAISSFQLQSRPFDSQQQQQINENWPNPAYYVVKKSNSLCDELALSLNSNQSELKTLMTQHSLPFNSVSSSGSTAASSDFSLINFQNFKAKLKLEKLWDDLESESFEDFKYIQRL